MRQQILEVLISSSVLILALALLRILLRGKISPRLQFALWLLVAVRLLVPVSLGQSAASVMNYVPQQQMSEILEDASIPAQVPQQVTALPVEGRHLQTKYCLRKHPRRRRKRRPLQRIWQRKAPGSGPRRLRFVTTSGALAQRLRSSLCWGRTRFWPLD